MALHVPFPQCPPIGRARGRRLIRPEALGAAALIRRALGDKPVAQAVCIYSSGADALVRHSVAQAAVPAIPLAAAAVPPDSLNHGS